MNRINYYQSSLIGLINRNLFTNIIQVGANDGRINDPIYDIVMNYPTKTRIALVEPQAEILGFLKENYKSHPNASVWNYAIGRTSVLKLYRLNPSYFNVFIKRYLQDSPPYRVPSGFTSSNKQHVINHITGNIPNDLSIQDVIEEIEVPTISLQDLLTKTDWAEKKVDILQIDVEGMDDEVVYACNIDQLRPRLINFEYSHLSESRYRKLCEFLVGIGYKVHAYSESDALAALD